MRFWKLNILFGNIPLSLPNLAALSMIHYISLNVKSIIKTFASFKTSKCPHVKSIFQYFLFMKSKVRIWQIFQSVDSNSSSSLAFQCQPVILLSFQGPLMYKLGRKYFNTFLTGKIYVRERAYVSKGSLDRVKFLQ